MQCNASPINCLVIGAPGAGKSTVCNLCAHGRNLADENGVSMFQISAGPATSTRDCCVAGIVRNGFRALDTIGLFPSIDGVPDDAWAVQSLLQAIKLAELCGGVHFLLFCMDNRFLDRTTKAWQFLLKVFGEEHCKRRLVLVFTRVPEQIMKMPQEDQLWHFSSISGLGEMLQMADNRFVCVDVDPIDRDSAVVEEELRQKRGDMYRELFGRLKQWSVRLGDSSDRIRAPHEIAADYNEFQQAFCDLAKRLANCLDSDKKAELIKRLIELDTVYFKQIWLFIHDGADIPIPEMNNAENDDANLAKIRFRTQSFDCNDLPSPSLECQGSQWVDFINVENAAYGLPKFVNDDGLTDPI